MTTRSIDQAHPVRPANRVARDAAVRWAKRHYEDEDPWRLLEIVQVATLDSLRDPNGRNAASVHPENAR